MYDLPVRYHHANVQSETVDRQFLITIKANFSKSELKVTI